MDIVDPYGSGNNSYPTPSVIIRNRRATSLVWSQSDYILDPGELGFETDTGFFKIGNGVLQWNALEYFVPEEFVVTLIENAVLLSNESSSALTAHINSETPHAVYDDGPSLEILYQNVKV